MIRSELVARIAEQNPHLYAQAAELIVDAILGRIVGALADGDRVELRDFGTFSTRNSNPRTSRNPRTGERVQVPAKAHVDFRPSKAMRARLNLDRVDPEREAGRIQRVS